MTARIVLRPDDAISTFRAGQGTGLQALDSASRLIGELTDDASTSAAALRGDRPRVPRRPERVELDSVNQNVRFTDNHLGRSAR
ncbi:hypothetical protein [Caballeronia sp. 15715]|uniref:hypothetical protein n=1 Tax=unclassified Caballeronia TaxID=2646786 RepID=UPI0039E26E25